MRASDLRTKLDEGLKTDVSGKTTPIQRLTPFLQALVQYLEEQEKIQDPIMHSDTGKVSSDDANQAAPGTPKSESGDASKATA